MMFRDMRSTTAQELGTTERGLSDDCLSSDSSLMSGMARVVQSLTVTIFFEELRQVVPE